MNVEILAIGSEVLSGFVTNTNASFISKLLLKHGIVTAYHSVIPDKAFYFKEIFPKIMERSDIVIVTGGLGPTCDDITRMLAAEMFDSPLVYHQDIAEDLKLRYGENLASLVDQSTVPQKANLLKNTLGTAFGLFFEQGSKKIFFLPGVPDEMEEMFKNEVLPRILEFYSGLHVFNRWLYFSSINEAQIDPYLRDLKKKYPNIDFGVYPSRGILSLHLSTAALSEKKADEIFNAPLQIINELFSKYVFNSLSGSIEEAILNKFIEKKITLTLAESCTGGAMAARLTSLPGASQYFKGSLVTYSNELKKEFLNVAEETLLKYGAVSQQVAEEMCRGLMKRTQTDWGIAVTGIAGPSGGRIDKPVGTVWVAIQKKDEELFSWKIQAKGNRQMVINFTINTVLGKLHHLIT